MLPLWTAVLDQLWPEGCSRWELRPRWAVLVARAAGGEAVGGGRAGGRGADPEGWVWVCQDVGAGDIPGTWVSAGAAWSRGHTAGGAGPPRGLLRGPRVPRGSPSPVGCGGAGELGRRVGEGPGPRESTSGGWKSGNGREPLSLSALNSLRPDSGLSSRLGWKQGRRGQ